MRQHLHLDSERKEMLALNECNVPKYFFKFCLADYSCFGYIPWSEAECFTIFLVLLNCGIFLCFIFLMILWLLNSSITL